MRKPILKRYPEFTHSDFTESPIWLNVHGADEREPWYGETDEVTYRPWDGHFPFDCSGDDLLSIAVAAEFRFADGHTADGFLSRPMSNGDFGDLQPAIFTSTTDSYGRKFISLYQALRRLAEESLRQLEESFQSHKPDLFPIEFNVKEGLLVPPLRGVAHGIYYRHQGKEVYL